MPTTTTTATLSLRGTGSYYGNLDGTGTGYNQDLPGKQGEHGGVLFYNAVALSGVFYAPPGSTIISASLQYSPSDPEATNVGSIFGALINDIDPVITESYFNSVPYDSIPKTINSVPLIVSDPTNVPEPVFDATALFQEIIDQSSWDTDCNVVLIGDYHGATSYTEEAHFSAAVEFEYPPVPEDALSTGWLSPTTVSQTSTGATTWTNLNNLLEEDGATADVSLAKDAVSEELVLSGFNFSGISSGTVLGIEVSITKYIRTPGSVFDSALYLSFDGNSTGSEDLASSEYWAEAASQQDVPPPTIAGWWGENWGRSEDLSDLSKIAIHFTAARGPAVGGTVDASVDSIRIRVWYTPPAVGLTKSLLTNNNGIWSPSVLHARINGSLTSVNSVYEKQNGVWVAIL